MLGPTDHRGNIVRTTIRRPGVRRHLRMLLASALAMGAVAAAPSAPSPTRASDDAACATPTGARSSTDDGAGDVLELKEGKAVKAWLRFEDGASSDLTWTLTRPTNVDGDEANPGQPRPASSPVSSAPPGPVVFEGQFIGHLDSFMLRTYAEQPHDQRLPDETKLDVFVGVDDVVLFRGRVDTNAHPTQINCHNSRTTAYTTAFDGLADGMRAKGIAVDERTTHTLRIEYGPAIDSFPAYGTPVRTFLYYGELTPSWVWTNVTDPLTPTRRLG